MEASPVSPAAAGGPELHLFGNSAGEDGVEFGVKAFFIVEEAPWAKHFNVHSASGIRTSVSELPQAVTFAGPLPGRGSDRCHASKAVVPEPD